ncbi:ADP-forming succinate--CoA ligase subunit beta [Leptolinea tardivitalis]|uniref:Succinate--CoA ligase [ADP-forming] subunit beta n=1 Tax=Leptolinea tardivitalis TaxID=229920 RepID=A0A0P6X0F6_9CHLR|nr:ADP-forming succinate--CoA ligase subunit beta [Leptolinea tardivitalis]KPL72638.1 succinyl-CoA synthetase subunit beta [Leptolinea tardivitalis]GAP21038.1 succinyl-CoA synthetase, beta subunit [Leptolinea tardivitalis]
MRLHEYQSKQIFAKYAIPIPNGRVASSSGEARQIAEELGGKVVVKAQVLVRGRGKSGGIRLAKSAREAEELAAAILGMEIKGLPVRKVLVDETVDILKEFYLGITTDRSLRTPVMISSFAGDTNIEEVARMAPEKIIRIPIDPLLGLRDYQARDMAAAIDLPRELWKSFIEICHGIWNVYNDFDATMVEVNPLVITNEQHLLALDGKMFIDENSLFRHPEMTDYRDMDSEGSVDNEARKFGLSYIKLDGNIGCLVNGAGLAMATMDMIHFSGGEPANFLDIGGGASADRVAAALRIVLLDTSIKSILINVFGGITRCDEVARGILTVMAENSISIPVVVRLEGTNAEEGRNLLKNTKLISVNSISEAVKVAIEAAERGM